MQTVMLGSAEPGSAPIVQVHDLYYAYPPPLAGAAPTEVLSGVSFDLAAGEFVALLGRVGAGKTTLCLALSGLVPHATGGIFRGQVIVAGLDTRHHAVARLAQSVGLVFQDPETQLTQMRVEDEVAFGPENLGLTRDEIGERVSWALEAVGLSEYRDRNPALLSGGEKQRVTIAATLAMRPQVLVLDEPTANLDPGGKAAVFAALLRLAEERRVTILLATQDVERVQRYAQRVLVLHEGQIALDGAPAAVFARVSDLAAWGIGAPHVAELSHLLSERRGHTYRFSSLSAAVTGLRALRKSTAGRMVPTPPAASTATAPAPPAPDEAVISAERVTFTYDDGTVALRGVTLAVPRGQFLALAGPNGSGKSTLAKHLNGLLKPAAGRLRIAGADTAPLRVAQLARRVGYVFQNPDHQIFAPTVREELAFGLRLQGLPAAAVEQRVNEALTLHDLAGCADLPPATLSLGQRRQVSLAAVLATQPEILVLDEPTGGLDWRSREEMMRRVARFNAAGGTVILITHDVRLIAEYAQRVVVLRAGQVMFDGTPTTLFAERTVLAAAQLTVPPILRLAQRLVPESLALPVRTASELIDVLQL
jgi:energy-coupling factor transporter ATP-binding protein EcfA2